MKLRKRAEGPEGLHGLQGTEGEAGVCREGSDEGTGVVKTFGIELQQSRMCCSALSPMVPLKGRTLWRYL